MSSIAVDPRLASASAVFFGRHGDVSALARQRDVFRQRLTPQQHRLDHLQQQVWHAVVVDADRQAKFAATAQALGVSLSAAHALLRVLLGDATPSRATLGR